MLNSPLARAAIVAGLTFAAYKYLPVGTAGKIVVLAVGSVAAAGVLSQAVPLVGQVLNGQLPGASAA